MMQGDLVVRKSYRGDVVFRIQDADQQRAILKGVEFRLLADAPISDLQRIEDLHLHRGTVQSLLKTKESVKLLELYKRTQREKMENGLPFDRDKMPYFELPGKVLHLDGDPAYLRKSMSVYGELRIPAEGHFVNEVDMAEALYRLLPLVKPDIVVITGHDGLLKHRPDPEIHSLNNYKNSINFARAVRVAREYERNRDALTVIAGACQSHFEALLHAGANFASSPKRILIHALDPVYIAAKVSYTPIKDTINIFDVISHTISGMEGLGGIETKGSYRIGLPKI
ncbi:sporulation peptidase YabG [Ferviditalea candida]|uniref:Sporulation peptidase YabG n=1 Tax=Ferviditalea candida TaxID=3108399 RepID=A0ABU5ZIR3_9BACL|nr:sporulation peptidase YabG [Paenibacillaceae bacterium T2]